MAPAKTLFISDWAMPPWLLSLLQAASRLPIVND